MKYNPDLHHRHSIRLQDYDYANAGAYFVTICCQNRINRFGEIVNNANNMDMDTHTVGAGFACPIMQPDCPIVQPDCPIMQPDCPIMQPDCPIMQPGAHSQNEQWGQPGQPEQPGQADPAPTRHMVNLNEFGKIVDEQWQNLTTKYPNINIGEYIIMPNHFHGIIEITERTVAIGNIIGYFKFKTTKMINLPEKLWQRNYWEHIIRNKAEHSRIAEYIRNNPILRGKKCLTEILP